MSTIKKGIKVFWFQLALGVCIAAVVVVLIWKALDRIMATPQLEVGNMRPQYELRITVVYNAVTLRQAADIDNRIRKAHEAACSIGTELTPLVIDNAPGEYWVCDYDSLTAALAIVGAKGRMAYVDSVWLDGKYRYYYWDTDSTYWTGDCDSVFTEYHRVVR